MAPKFSVAQSQKKSAPNESKKRHFGAKAPLLVTLALKFQNFLLPIQLLNNVEEIIPSKFFYKKFKNHKPREMSNSWKTPGLPDFLEASRPESQINSACFRPDFCTQKMGGMYPEPLLFSCFFAFLLPNNFRLSNISKF